MFYWKHQPFQPKPVSVETVDPSRTRPNCSKKVVFHACYFNLFYQPAISMFYDSSINLKISRMPLLISGVYVRLKNRKVSTHDVYIKYLSISHLKYINSKVKWTFSSYYDRPFSADKVSQQSCVEEESSTTEAATETIGDTDEGRSSEYQGEGMKGTRQSEAESNPKKGLYD